MAHFLEQGACELQRRAFNPKFALMRYALLSWRVEQEAGPLGCSAAVPAMHHSHQSSLLPPLAADVIPTATYYVGISFNLMCLWLCWRYPRRAEPEVCCSSSRLRSAFFGLTIMHA